MKSVSIECRTSAAVHSGNSHPAANPAGTEIRRGAGVETEQRHPPIVVVELESAVITLGIDASAFAQGIA